MRPGRGSAAKGSAPTFFGGLDRAGASAERRGTTATDCIDVQALPVRMDKDLNNVIEEPGVGLANLWICAAASCPAVNGDGYLDIGEYVANAQGDAQGVGAFEFDVPCDNRIFAVSIDGSGWLYSTSRVAGVDVKDLQKVFGRNGSTCASPVPRQDPLPQAGDP